MTAKVIKLNFFISFLLVLSYLSIEIYSLLY
nr:MAG TPA: hypothetical protein [Caudoviricetes sp.]